MSSLHHQEVDLGWVRVLTHEGHDGPPSPEFQQKVMARAGEVATAYGYSQRASGITIGPAHRVAGL